MRWLALAAAALLGACAADPVADTSRLRAPPAQWMTAAPALSEKANCDASSDSMKCRLEYDLAVRKQYDEVADRQGALQNWVRVLLAKNKGNTQ